jgi:peptidoglycan/LPS O-acetylase OafA/YrhL
MVGWGLRMQPSFAQLSEAPAAESAPLDRAIVDDIVPPSVNRGFGGRGITIGQRWVALNGRPRGFDYIRIGLAVSVLLWHSYQVSYGTPAALAFWETPGGTFLPIILPAFFALSGFLVSASMYRNADLKTFLALRVIRIFPALMVEVLFAALVIGPLLTTFALAKYFSDWKFYTYFWNMLGRIHYFLPGLFANNPEQFIVNSQLWTVPYELDCYVMISVLYAVGMFSRKYLVLPLFILASAVVVALNFLQGINAMHAGGVDGSVLVLSFFSGIVLFSFKDAIPWNGCFALVSFALAILMTRTPYVISAMTVHVMPIFAAYCTIYVGLLNPRSSLVVRSGDYSYGVYLYSCPIQQSVADIFGTGGGWFANVLIALPTTVVFALFSWWCIERPFLRIRRLIGAKAVRQPHPREQCAHQEVEQVAETGHGNRLTIA